MRAVLPYLLLAVAGLGSLACSAAMVRAGLAEKSLSLSNEQVLAAQDLAKKGERTEAFELAKTAVATCSDNPYARRELAMHLFARNKPDLAIAELRTACQSSTGDVKLAVELAAALDARGLTREATQVLQRTARANPRNGLALTALSSHELKAGRNAEALEAAREAVRQAPRIQAAHANLGLARLRSGDDSGALESFREALRLGGAEPSIFLHAAATAAKLGYYSESLRYARSAVSLSPGDADAWVALGATLLAMGDRPGSRKAFAQAAALDPDRTTALKLSSSNP